MQLSEHFSLAELTASQTAARRGIDQTPDQHVLAALRDTANRMEAVRTLLGGRVITVSSGYRSPALNKAVGGARNSAHLTGHAVDFNCYAYGNPLAVARAIALSDIVYDQLIHEYGRWVHISFAPALRQMDLTIGPKGTVEGLVAL